MPLYSPTFIDRVRVASDIVDVIGASLPLKRAGANFVTLCPFHREKSPSFNVNPGRQIFHCFGCHKGGDVFKFVQEYENISFPEAIERLAERARIPLEYETGSPAAAQARSAKDGLLKLHEAICQRWQNCLASEAAGQVARDYLTKRGVSPEAVKEFRIGAAPEAWDDTVNWAKAKGFDAALCEQAGLIIRKEDTGRPDERSRVRLYDRFRGRLMFPICDEQGRVIAFSGRVLQGDEKTAKYVNSPETPIFTKGRVLFALDKAKRAILEAGHAIICEGQLDTIACHSAGIRHVVAPQGTALTADHARILKRYVDEVVLCFDGDKAGRSAAVRSLDDLLSSGIAIRVASIPPPDDPDSYIRKFGADQFRSIISRAKEFFSFYGDLLVAENDVESEKGRLTIVRALGDAVAKTRSTAVSARCAQMFAGMLGLAPLTAFEDFQKLYDQAVARLGPSAEQDPAAGDDPSQEITSLPDGPDTWILRFLIQADEDSLAWATIHLDPNWITNPTVRRIIELRLLDNSTEPSTMIPRLLEKLGTDRLARYLVTEAANHKRELLSLRSNLMQATRRIRDSWIDRQLVLLSSRLSDPNLDVTDLKRVNEHRLALRSMKAQALTPLGEA